MAIEESFSATAAEGLVVDQPSASEADIVEKHIIYYINTALHQTMKAEEVDPVTGERTEMQFYDTPEVHRVMVRDHVRTAIFQEALFAAVNEGDVVLDIGAGSGILSLFAAQAGASKVYAVEPTSAAKLARELAVRNNLDGTVEVIEKMIEDVELPGKVDVLVSEWLGTYGVDENMLAPVLFARDRWLKPGGRMLPARVTAWLAPVFSDVCVETGFFHGRPYGLDLAPLQESSLHELMQFRHVLSDLQAEPAAMWTTDAYRFPAEEANLPFEASLTFTFDRQARVNALAAWFDAEFGNGIVLSNAPWRAYMHWGQFPCPLERTIELEPGAQMAVKFACVPAGFGYCHHTWSARVGSGPWEHHGTDQ